MTKVLQVKSGSVWTEEFHFMTSNQSLVLPVPEMTELGKVCTGEIIPSNQQAIAKDLQLQCSVSGAGELM